MRRYLIATFVLIVLTVPVAAYAQGNGNAQGVQAGEATQSRSQTQEQARVGEQECVQEQVRSQQQTQAREQEQLQTTEQLQLQEQTKLQEQECDELLTQYTEQLRDRLHLTDGTNEEGTSFPELVKQWVHRFMEQLNS